MKHQLVIVHIITLAICLGVGCHTASAQQLQLFSPDVYKVATHQQTVVMRFLDRYFHMLMDEDKSMVPTRMKDDKVYFRQGTLDNLYAVSDTMPFSMALVDRHYEVSWAKDGAPFVSLAFPAQYDLLFGMNQEEAQHCLRDSIISAPFVSLLPALPDSLRLTEGNIWSSIPASFELESLNNATYYYRTDTGLVAVFEPQYLAYSAANLFHGLLTDRDYRMHIEQSVYGLRTISYMITLRQWLNYCAYWNMEVFFAIEEEREDGLLCLLIARNREFSFNHLLSIVIPDKFVCDSQAVLKTRLTPYIPTHNVKNIYQQSTTKRKKKRW